MEQKEQEYTDKVGIRTLEITENQTKLVITNQHNETIRSFSLLSGECIGNYENFSKPVRKIVCYDERIIGASWDGTVQIINGFGQTECEFELGGKLASIKKHKNYIVVGRSNDSGEDAYHMFYVIDIDRKQMVKQFFHGISYHESLDSVIDPEDGSCYASSDEGSIIRFGLEPDDHMTKLIYFDNIPARFINLLKWKGKKYLLSGYSGCKVRAHILNDNGFSRPLEFFGHTDKINGIEVLPPPLNNYFISASKDATAVVWNIESDKPMHTLDGHTDWIWDVKSFRRKNRTYVLTCGQDGQLIIHSIYGKHLGKLLNLAYGYYLWIIPDHEDKSKVYVKTNLEEIPDRFIEKKFDIRKIENLDRMWI